MRGDRIRWLMIAVVILGIDLGAVALTLRAIDRPTGGIGGGPFSQYSIIQQYPDGRIVSEVWDWRRKIRISRTVTRPATWAVQVLVWSPIPAAGALTLAVLKMHRSKSVRQLVRDVRVPRISTRGLMFLVTAVGVEGGLIVGTMRYSGHNPEKANWYEIGLGLLILHAVAFLPAGLAVAWREIKVRRLRG